VYDRYEKCVRDLLQRLFVRVRYSYGRECNSRFLLKCVAHWTFVARFLAPPLPLFRVSYGFAVEHNCDDDIGQNHNEIRLLISLQSPEARSLVSDESTNARKDRCEFE